MDEFMIDYSSTCNVYWVLRLPAWAIEMAGEDGTWTNDDGDSYTPYDCARIEGEFAHKHEAKAFMRTLMGG